MSWDPDTYLAFADLRERPFRELIDRIPDIEVLTAIDLGCGTGNSTAAAAARFPKTDFTGLDSSAEMLAKAQKDLPKLTWVEADIGAWTSPPIYDLVVSNAALQWVSNHDQVFRNIVGAVKPSAAIAIQMPRNFDAPSHQCLYETASDGPWAATTEALIRRDPVDAPGIYYDRLAPHFAHVDIWETEYGQILDGDDPVFDWTSGTALRPFLAALEGEMLDGFCEAYKSRLRKAYPKQADGRTLFPSSGFSWLPRDEPAAG